MVVALTIIFTMVHVYGDGGDGDEGDVGFRGVSPPLQGSSSYTDIETEKRG